MTLKWLIHWGILTPLLAISPGSHDFPVYLATQLKQKTNFGLAPQDKYTGKLNTNTKLRKCLTKLEMVYACLLGTGKAV